MQKGGGYRERNGVQKREGGKRWGGERVTDSETGCRSGAKDGGGGCTESETGCRRDAESEERIGLKAVQKVKRAAKNKKGCK